MMGYMLRRGGWIVVLFTPAIWAFFGVLKLAGFLLGQIVVPISLFWNPRQFWLWDNDEAGFLRGDFPTRWGLYVDRAWRNPSGNSKYVLEAVFGNPQIFEQSGNVTTDELFVDPMEDPGFKWRWRQVKMLTSLRITFGKSRPQGKKELYFGFKIGSNTPGFGFTAQARLF